ncbi:MAG: DivIVA domain-containing protein, partial [Oscillospiraceae bacterium]|nr:DivIVA domain-containing protein [Oscillospiraceae bacterium]
MMTPQEVANCTFAKAAIGGYHMTSVDEFLDKLTEDYSALYKENAALKAKLKVMVDKMNEYREMEEAMRSTLLTAQKMATSMVAEAEQKRNAMIASASADAQNRRDELAKEVETEERRLMEIRQRVDRELMAERKRLAYGKEALRKFISEVTAVCNDELALLQRLPDLPMEEEKLQTAPAV